MSDGQDTETWHSTDEWSEPVVVDDNIARQLMVPASDISVVSESAGALEVSNSFGT